MGRSRKGREKIKGGEERKEKFKFAFNVFLHGFCVGFSRLMIY